MKPEKKVVHSANLPARLPIYQTATVWLLVDRFDTPPLWRGVIYAVLALIWVGAFIRLWVEKPTRIWNER